MKQCTKCNLEQSIESFRKRSKVEYKRYGNNQYDNVCRNCRKEYDRFRHTRDKDKERKSHNARMETLNGKFIAWKNNAKLRGLSWELNLDDIKNQSLVCAYTGTELTFKMNHPNTISLDRIDSSKGYLKDNIVLCCSVINIMKNDMNKQEFFNWCNKVSQFNSPSINSLKF